MHRRGELAAECFETRAKAGEVSESYMVRFGWTAGRAGDGWARLHPRPTSGTQCTHAFNPITHTHPACAALCGTNLCSHSWTALPYAGELKAALGSVGVALVVGGGLVYSIGALVYALRWPDPLPATFGERA